jgi:Ankyrin repeat
LCNDAKDVGMVKELGKLFAAIVQDDRVTLKALLKADSSLATRRAVQARLYETGIFHWHYAGDTPLYLAAAGYRVTIVPMLLAAGADPMAAANQLGEIELDLFDLAGELELALVRVGRGDRGGHFAWTSENYRLRRAESLFGAGGQCCGEPIRHRRSCGETVRRRGRSCA